jgi:hypothetical protein
VGQRVGHPQFYGGGSVVSGGAALGVGGCGSTPECRGAAPAY